MGSSEVLARRLVAVALLAACSPPPGPAPRPPVAPPAPPASALASASAAAPEPSVLPARLLMVNHVKLPFDIEKTAVKAPCDLARAYRGTIGATKVSLVIHPAAEGSTELQGQSHYDRDGEGLELSGQRSGAVRFSLKEKRGGTFQGACDPATGALRGGFEVGAKTTSFELLPQPQGWPGLVWVVRKTLFEANDEDPVCATQGALDAANEVESAEGATVLCLPRDPRKRKAFLADKELGHCWAEDEGLRVFGGKSPDLDRKVNHLLRDSTSFEDNVKALAKCRPPHSLWASERLVELGSGILVVQVETSEDEGGAHPRNGVSQSIAIDLESGEQVERADVVTDLPRLRELAAACIPIFAAASEGFDEMPQGKIARCGEEGTDAFYLWGCPTALDEPFWTLTTRGVVIGGLGHPHVTSALDGTGPILPWDVLAREGLLPVKSRVSRLFRDVAPASPSALPCSSAYLGDEWLFWR